MRYWRIVFLLSFLMVISCSGNKIIKDTDRAKQNIATEEEVSPPPFFLGAGDEVFIRVWRNDDLNREVRIDPSGNIYLPLIGEIRASGLTISQLREEMTSRLSKYIITPQVDINVSTLKSQKIHVLGEVRSPGTFTLEVNTLAWEAISKAGGFTTDANKKKVLLVRAEKGAATVEAMNMHDMLKYGELPEDIYLRNGDVIYVVPTFIANLERFMSRFRNIIDPFVTLERGIILYPGARDVLRGKKSGRDVIVSP